MISPEEEFKRVGVSIILALVVVVICCYVALHVTDNIETISNQRLPDIAVCKICHTDLNATTNASACSACEKIWSNVYT